MKLPTFRMKEKSEKIRAEIWIFATYSMTSYKRFYYELNYVLMNVITLVL